MTTNTALGLTIIQDLRKLLDQPDRWTTGSYARNAKGRPMMPEDPEATCWCLMGALGKVAGFQPTRERDYAYQTIKATIIERVPGLATSDNPLACFNDGGTYYHSMISMLDHAIERAKKQDEASRVR